MVDSCPGLSSVDIRPSIDYISSAWVFKDTDIEPVDFAEGLAPWLLKK